MQSSPLPGYSPSIRRGPNGLTGLLFIGDPHIEGRTPGFRKDNYPEAILRKFQWSLEYAAQHDLQPILLGDLFDKPRDNPNWLISRLLDMIADEYVPTIYGNHDCANPSLDDNDSFTLLLKAGALYLLDRDHLWTSTIEGRTILVGGSSYRHEIPSNFAWEPAAEKRGADLTVWITHHDLVFPSEEEAAITNLFEIEGIDYVINGHIHRRSPTVVVRGGTTWVNPGNIARRSRSDAIRGHVPAVLKMDIAADGQWMHYVDVPHEAPDKVFFDLNSLATGEQPESQSSFVSGLALLQSRKTFSGAGLLEFLHANVTQFETEVATEIMQLAQEVLTPNPT
ncbi:MAG: exonuclease SbcCD subunit D [Pirellula sp.]|jgi:predicted phosphodiesterase|nr:metallophosphoesterase family protein [Planctomycetota bacterium]